MRILMLALILANLGFLAWSQWFAPTSDGLPAGRSNESMGAGLMLAGETEPTTQSREAVTESAAADPEPVETDAPALATEEVATADAVTEDIEDVGNGDGSGEPQGGDDTMLAAADPADRCVSLGPFDELAIAEIAEARLADRGYAARIREAGGQIRSGFWVYLPPQPSRGDAKDIEAQLRQKGVSDLFIVTGSENRNAISLGLFSTPDRADQRAAEIGRLGFSPQIAERFRDATLYWLDYRESGDDRLEPQSLGVMAADELIPEKRPRDCAAADFAAG